MKKKQKQIIVKPAISIKPTKKKLIFPGAIFWLVGILFATFILYLPVISHQFVNWDDQRYVYENPYITKLSAENLKYFFTHHYFLMYLPITLLSYAIEYQFAGLNPSLYHFTNIFLHLINTGLLFWFCLLLFKQLAYKRNLELSIIISSLFGLAAVHVESVAWVAERKDVLYTSFYLLSLLIYLKYTINQKIKYLGLSAFLFLLSLISKAQAMPLAIIIILLDYTLQRKIFSRKVILEKIPFILLAVIFGLVAILATRSEGTEKLRALPFVERIFYACYAYIMYIVKMIIPLKLSAIYPFPKNPDGSTPFYIWFFILPIFAVLAGFIYALKKSRESAFGIVFYTFSIVLVLQIFAYHNVAMADRYSYVSSIGIFLLIGIGFDKLINLKPKLEKIIYGFMALFIVFQFYMSNNRIPVWKNSINLWTDVIDQYPQVATAFYNRGIEYYNKGEYQKSLSDLKAVIALDSAGSGNYFALGNTYDKLGKLDQAIVSFTKSITIDKTNKDAYANRAILLARTGDVKKAVEDFNHVLEIDPTHFTSYSNRGNSKVMLGDIDGAIEDYTKAITYNPDYSDALFNRGMAKVRKNLLDEAIADYNQAIDVKPDYPDAYYNRGVAYALKGNMEQAIKDYSQTISQNPGYVDAYFNRGIARFTSKDFNEAFADFTSVIKLLPNNPLPYYRRALVSMALNKRNEACSDFETAYKMGMKNIEVDLRKYCLK